MTGTILLSAVAIGGAALFAALLAAFGASDPAGDVPSIGTGSDPDDDPTGEDPTAEDPTAGDDDPTGEDPTGDDPTADDPPLRQGFQPTNTTPARTLPPLRGEPTPGGAYATRSGDTLLGVAGRAYGLGPGAARLRAAQAIVDANPAGLRSAAGQGSGLFRDRVDLGPAFLPRWRRDPQTPAQQVEPGSTWAVLTIPEL